MPNDGEEKETNMPRNLHNAAELLVATKQRNSLNRMHGTTSTMLATLKAGPDGQTTQSMGRAAICWLCGYTGVRYTHSDRHALNCGISCLITFGWLCCCRPACKCREVSRDTNKSGRNLWLLWFGCPDKLSGSDNIGWTNCSLDRACCATNRNLY